MPQHYSQAKTDPHTQESNQSIKTAPPIATTNPAALLNPVSLATLAPSAFELVVCKAAALEALVLVAAAAVLVELLVLVVETGQLAVQGIALVKGMLLT